VASAFERRHSEHQVTSGISAKDEYNRTIGALFAVYWLMRIGVDGERGFSYGVDDKTWEVKKEGDKMSQPDKRKAFLEKNEWLRLQELLIDAGMIVKHSSGEVEVQIERTAAMLALTALHDIMKVEALLPRMDKAHAPYLGFVEGDIINDHDIALGYVLDWYSEHLPSFVMLPVEQQKSVRFTQSKMGFNHGWLVQAEAPPGALFTTMRKLVMSGGMAPQDIAFYFTHWLTDLAGAEPSPLFGCEKFVLKFPLPVLISFIRSFGVLDKLAVKNETEVFEDYLIRRWDEIQDKVGPPPEGPAAVAVMRLVIQAQEPAKQVAVVKAFAALPREDQRILAEEMCRTGLPEQEYQASTIEKRGGPSVLVYYSPAFVRQLAPDHAKDALRLLAEVYRRSRSLWPLKPEADEEDSTVTVRIDQIKELNLFDIQSIYAGGESWCLSKRNAKEGVIERQPLDVLAKSLQKDTYKVLKFWRVMAETKTGDDFYKNSMQKHVMHAVGRAVQQQVRAGAIDRDDDSDSLSNFSDNTDKSGSFTPRNPSPTRTRRISFVKFKEALPDPMSA